MIDKESLLLLLYIKKLLLQFSFHRELTSLVTYFKKVQISMFDIFRYFFTPIYIYFFGLIGDFMYPFL